MAILQPKKSRDKKTSFYSVENTIENSPATTSLEKLLPKIKKRNII
jgi:hypothetical protein